MWAISAQFEDHRLVHGLGWCLRLEKNTLPIDVVLNEIEQALHAQLFYLAIVMALTVPDICAALEDRNGRTKSDRYKTWYRANLGDKYPFMTADDCYSLRCGVIHQGRMGSGENSQYGRVIFTIPDGRGNVFHRNIINDALNLDTVRFCRDVIGAARSWYKENQNNPHVVSNLPNLVQFRPNGIAPYIVGVPLIS
jgi:hypothetical protein